MSEKPPAGWYPHSTGTVRWWDGEQWTEHTPPPPPTQAAPAAAAPPEQPAHGDPVLRAAEGESRELRHSVGSRRAVVETSPQTGEPSGGGKGLAMTALGVAIVSLLLCWIPVVNNVVFFLGVVGLVLASIAYRRARKGKSEGRGMAFAAILISILSLVGVIATQAFYESVLTDMEEAITGETDGGSGDDSPADGDKTSSAEPEILPLGQEAKVGSDYSIAVTKVKLNADQAVKRANEFNEPPKNGRFVIATLDATYTGGDEGEVWADLEATFAGSDNRQYDASSCEAVVKDAMVDVPTLNNGGEATFKVCFDVPPEATDEGSIFVDETAAFDNDSRVYWEIR